MKFQIVCQSCGHVSEREEEFLDIPVALTGRTRLEQALKEMYNDSELLEGANQYHCSTCDRLVDAERVCHKYLHDLHITFKTKVYDSIKLCGAECVTLVYSGLLAVKDTKIQAGVVSICVPCPIFYVCICHDLNKYHTVQYNIGMAWPSGCSTNCLYLWHYWLV